MKHPRILMQQADGSPGSGSPPPAPAPTDAPANGAAPAQAVDVSSIVSQVRDGLFAELRRAGVLGGKEKSGKSPAASPETPAPAQPDLSTLRALDRAVARHPHAARLSDAAYKRLERAYVEESPTDAGQWLTDYFADLGIEASTNPAAPAATTAAPAPRTAVPVTSGGGSTPVSQAALEERDLISLSESDRQHLIKQKGARWYMEKLAEQNKGKSVRIGR